MLRTCFLCAVLLCTWIGTGFAKDATVEIEGRYWMPDMDGKIRVTSNGVGTAVDFKDDLGFTDKNFPEGRLTWYTGDNSRIRFAYVHIKYSGDEVLSRTIQFNGTTYSANAPVSSDLSLDYLRLGWIWQFINLGNGTFRLGTIVEVKGLFARASIDAPTLGVGSRESIAVPLPTVGAVLDLKLHRMVGVFAELSGITAGKYGSFIDGEAGVKFAPTKNLAVVGGYRGFRVNAENNSDYIKMTVQGPYLGATLRF